MTCSCFEAELEVEYAHMKPELFRKKRVDGLRYLAPSGAELDGSGNSIIDLAEARVRRGLLLEEANITPEPATPGADLEVVEVPKEDFEQSNVTLEALEATNIVPVHRFLWYAQRRRGVEKQPVILDDSVQALFDKTVTPGRTWVGEYAMVSKETEAGIRPVYRAIVVEGRFNGGFRRLTPLRRKKAA